MDYGLWAMDRRGAKASFKGLLVVLMVLCPLSVVRCPLFASSKQSHEKKIEQAVQKEEAGDYETAQALYEEVLKENPDQEAALFGLAQVFYWEGEYQKSIDTFLKLLEKNPNHLDAMLGASKVYLAMGNQKKAREYLVKAQKVDPEDKEVQEMEPQIAAKKTKIIIHGGYSLYDQNYAVETHSEFQEISVAKEESYGVGLKSTYLRKFGRSGFETGLFGHYYFMEKTRVNVGFAFAPEVNILPKQSYTAGVEYRVWKFVPRVDYLFQDYSQANLQFLKPGLYVEPLSFLRVGGGYEFHRLSAGANTQNLTGGFATVKISLLDWISLHGFYERVQRSFEGGRAPTPFVRYNANIGGGGFGFDFAASYSLRFNAFLERRSNGDEVGAYTLALGFNF